MKDRALAFIKKYLYELLIKKLFGAALGGVKGFVIQTLYNRLWKETFRPFLLRMYRKAKTAIRRVFKKSAAKDLEDAKTKDEFESATDNLP